MFFYIGDNCPLTALKQVEPRLFLDDGWNQKNGIWYKGYSTDCILGNALADIVDGYQPNGKWCVINKEIIYHPQLRGFPIYKKNDSITNLQLADYEIVVYDNFHPDSFADDLTIDQASILIGDILVENTKDFYKYNQPANMTMLFSAGLDTLTAWVILDQVTQDYTISLHIPKEGETTLLEWLGTERNYTSDLIDKVSVDYWGYYHANFYKELNWNITGYYAEVLTYRDGEAINAIARYHGKTIDTLASETDYLYWFLKRPNIIEKYRDSKVECSDEVQLKKFLWSTIWYDHQMWHLDKNLMFSPFADIRIPKTVNRMSIADITSNCVSGEIQRQIVKRFRPDLLSLLSDYKNEQDIWENFKKNFNVSMLDWDTKLIYR